MTILTVVIFNIVEKHLRLVLRGLANVTYVTCVNAFCAVNINHL